MDETTLPESFADKLLELQASMEYEGTMDTIRELNDLYRAGIDYYIQKQPKKAFHLQKKMTHLLANPDNIRILEREVTKQADSTSEPTCVKEKKIRDPLDHKSRLNTRKIKEQVNKFHSVAETCIQNIVENSNKVAEKIQRLKNKDINRQEEELKGRIMLKRVRSQEKLNKIPTLTQISLNSIPDKEGKLLSSPNTDTGSPILSKLIE